jgi:hypothetical protein
LELACPIRIGNGVWIGGGVIILPGVTLAMAASSAPAALCSGACCPAGDPARIIRQPRLIAGQNEEAATLLAEALQIAEKTGERWFTAELSRCKSQLLLRPRNCTAKP